MADQGKKVMEAEPKAAVPIKDRLVWDFDQTAQMLNVSRRFVDVLLDRDATFPRPVGIGGQRKQGFRADEIRKWFAARKAVR